MRAYTPTSSDDDLGHFDLVVKVYFANEHKDFPEVQLSPSCFWPEALLLRLPCSCILLLPPCSVSVPLLWAACQRRVAGSSQGRACQEMARACAASALVESLSVKSVAPDAGRAHEPAHREDEAGGNH